MEQSKLIKVSFDYHGCYLEHKEFFDIMAIALQTLNHKVGIITGVRDKDPFTNVDNKQEILNNLGFKPDFIHMWGQNETISNAEQWKVARLSQEEVNVHFDDDASLLKRWTTGQIIKTMNSNDPKKF